MIIQTDITDLPKAAADVIVRAETSGKPYFLLIEEEGTDIASHNHDLAGMKKPFIILIRPSKPPLNSVRRTQPSLFWPITKRAGYPVGAVLNPPNTRAGTFPFSPRENTPVYFQANWTTRKSIIKSAEYCLRRHKVL